MRKIACLFFSIIMENRAWASDIHVGSIHKHPDSLQHWPRYLEQLMEYTSSFSKPLYSLCTGPNTHILTHNIYLMNVSVLTKEINLCFTQHITCTVCERKRSACCESGWSSDGHLLCPPFILSLSPGLLLI